MHVTVWRLELRRKDNQTIVQSKTRTHEFLNWNFGLGLVFVCFLGLAFYMFLC